MWVKTRSAELLRPASRIMDMEGAYRNSAGMSRIRLRMEWRPQEAACFLCSKVSLSFQSLLFQSKSKVRHQILARDESGMNIVIRQDERSDLKDSYEHGIEIILLR